MKQFICFTRKEFIHIFRDSRTLLILLVMPAVLITLFGFVVTTEVRGAIATICDEAMTQDSRRIAETIGTSQYFSLTSPCGSIDVAEDKLRSGQADVAVCINRDGEVLILCDGSEPNQAQMRGAYMMQIITPLLSEGSSISSPSYTGGVVARSLFNPQQRSEYNFVPGVIGLIVLLICAMMTSIAIVSEKENGTMELLLASPLSPLTIISAKLIPYFFFSSINLITILLLSHYLLGVPFVGSLTAFVVVTLLYIVVSLALGLLISTVVRTQMAALLLSLLLIVPTMYLSNFVFPLDSLPLPMQGVSNIVPAKWYIDAARRILVQGVEVRYVVKDFAILFVMAVVLMVISVKLFKKRLS
ncbi:MAG: ABC transporter permease [Prevotellaceae bacterium]|nr:ABC transporter permease [Prevotellaceae bacterium]